jgi:hypothetical protein
MNTATKVGAFAAGVAALFAISAAAGNAVGDSVVPLADPPTTHDADVHDERANDESNIHEAEDHGRAEHAGRASTAADIPGGLMVSQDGYTFALSQTRTAAGSDVTVSFVIEDADGAAVTDFAVEHEKRLHLIAVRRDLTGFQHVHPTMAEDGTWSTTLDLTPGSWRLFADFRASGADALTLGADLSVPGNHWSQALPAESNTAQVGDYTVTLDGRLVPGESSKVRLSVDKDGEPVTDLEPYLGAYGHLVALRAGDLAYLHVHPDGEPGDGRTEPGPAVTFHTQVPSAGDYRLYLDFKHAGVVRTAAFTVSAHH